MSASVENALVHIRAAMQSLELEAYRMDKQDMIQVGGFTIAEELKRVDSALGPTGESMFGRMADSVTDCYTELQAALLALKS